MLWSHWPYFHWNVSKPWLQRVELFENYANVAMQSDNVTFLSFFTRWRHHPKNSWNIFQIQITPLLWRPQGLQGCLEKQNYPLSWNLVFWCAKIGPKIQKLHKTTICVVVFLVISEVFWTFLLLGPILAHQTTKFQLSGWFCFSRHPWEPWGRQSSRMKPKSADLVTVVT